MSTTHAEIDRMWAEDCIWNPEGDFNHESARSDRLHAKYVAILRNERRHLHTLESALARLNREKSYFYMDGHDEVTRAKKWELPPGDRTVLRTDLKWVVPGDEDIIEAKGHVASQEAKVEMLVNIVKKLNDRGWGIKNSIKWIEFQSGKN
jgi:Recombination, repair and ssDNA binding protein UvsY